MTSSSTDAHDTVDVAGGLAPEFRVWLPVDRVAITIARSIVRRVVTFRDDDAESSFLIAVTEVTANAVDEHRRLGLSDDILLLVIGGAQPSVSISDRGRGLDQALVDGVQPNAVAASAESGRGLTLARAFLPALSFEVDDSGTTATLPLIDHGILA